MTRAGNSRTPASAASLPSCAASVTLPVSMPCTSPNSLRGLGARLALDGFAHERGGSGRDRAAAAFEAQVADQVAGQVDVEMQAVAAQRVVAFGVAAGVRQAAAVSRAAVVIDDHVAVEIGEVHQRSIRMASMEGVVQGVDLPARVVEAERRARRRRHAEELHHRHRAVMARAHRDAVRVEHRAEVVRVHALDRERDEAALGRRRADQREPGDCGEPRGRVVVQVPLVGGDTRLADAGRGSRSPRRGRRRRRCSACRPRSGTAGRSRSSPRTTP